MTILLVLVAMSRKTSIWRWEQGFREGGGKVEQGGGIRERVGPAWGGVGARQVEPDLGWILTAVPVALHGLLGFGQRMQT